MMDELNGFTLLTIVMFIVLLCRFNSRFGKAEREFNEMKKRMDEFLKAQANKVPAEVKLEEPKPVKVVEKELSVLPRTTEVLPVTVPQREEPLKEETFVEEKPNRMAEDRTDKALNDVPYQTIC